MFAFAASFLKAGTSCHLERLICILGTDPGLCSPEGTHRDLEQCLCQQCNLWKHSFFMALHDEPDHLCSPGAAESIATSSRQSLGRWVSQTFTTCIFLNSISNPEPHRIADDACCLWLLIDCNFSLAIVGRKDTQTFTFCSRESLRNGCLLHVLLLSIRRSDLGCPGFSGNLVLIAVLSIQQLSLCTTSSCPEYTS